MDLEEMVFSIDTDKSENFLGQGGDIDMTPRWGSSSRDQGYFY